MVQTWSPDVPFVTAWWIDTAAEQIDSTLTLACFGRGRRHYCHICRILNVRRKPNRTGAQTVTWRQRDRHTDTQFSSHVENHISSVSGRRGLWNIDEGTELLASLYYLRIWDILVVGLAYAAAGSSFFYRVTLTYTIITRAVMSVSGIHSVYTSRVFWKSEASLLDRLHAMIIDLYIINIFELDNRKHEVTKWTMLNRNISTNNRN